MLEEKELSIIYKKHSTELLTYIYSFVRSRDTSEDILQEAFERLIRYSREHYVDLATVRPFLYKICRNRSIDHIKKNGRISTSNIDDHQDISNGEDLLADIERRELLDRVHDLIDRKDPLTRSIFYMKAELDKTYIEIAEALGVSERTTKRKMHALLEYLSEELDKTGFTKILSILIA